MQTLTIRGTDIVTSQLGLGCAALYQEASNRRRRELLEAAYGAGIIHFDVAPMYGLGLAELELGRFAAGRRDRIVIATKFGIQPTALARGIGHLQWPLRRLLSAAPSVNRRARSAAPHPKSGRLGGVVYRNTGFDSAAARASLERSLRDMQTDHVDLLLLHDPRPGDVRSDDVRAYLEKARGMGLIRAWGVSGEPESVCAAVDMLGDNVPVLQVPSEPFRQAACDPYPVGPGRITFRVLGSALAAILKHVEADPAHRRRWREATGRDCAASRVIAELLLRRAIRDNPNGVVLFGTHRTEHVVSAAGAATASPTAEDAPLDAFDRLLSAEGAEIALGSLPPGGR